MKIPTWYRRSIYGAINEIAKEAWELGKEMPKTTLNDNQRTNLITETAKMMGNYKDGRTAAGRFFREHIKKSKLPMIHICETDYGTVEIEYE